MITITSSPVASPLPTPVSDCLQWCFQGESADAIETAGAFARVTVNFPAVPTIPANGTAFVIWGKAFTVNNSVAFTANTFQVTASGTTSALNFRAMLRANFFFTTATDIATDGITARNTVVTWKECGQQDNFTGVNMDFAGLTSAAATSAAINGITPVFVDGYMIQARLLNSLGEPITKFKGFMPRFTCDEVEGICIDFMGDAKRIVYTPMPDLAIDSEIDPSIGGMTELLRVEYGWVYRGANCEPLTGEFASTAEVLVINTVFEPDEQYRMARYSINDPGFPISVLQIGGDNVVQWLTNQPLNHKVSRTSFCWLWTLGAVPSAATLGFTFDHYTLVVDVYGLSGIFITNFTIEYIQTDAWRVICCNVSPARVALESGQNIKNIGRYDVRLTARPAGDGDSYNLTQELKYGIDHECGNNTDLYFLTPAGGIGTISATIEEREVIQNGTEICLNTPCSQTRVESAKYKGRGYTNIRSQDRITLRARQNFNDEEVEFFRTFKASPERWIQVKQKEIGIGVETDTWIARKFLVETGGVRILQSGDYIDLMITGTMADDIPVQWGKKSS